MDCGWRVDRVYFPDKFFSEGENAEGGLSGELFHHVKYLFRYCPGSIDERIYGDVYQGG